MTDTELVTVLDSVHNYRRHYHTDPEACRVVSPDDDTTEITKAKADRLNLEPCSWCEKSVDVGGYDRSILDAAREHDPEPTGQEIADD